MSTATFPLYLAGRARETASTIDVENKHTGEIDARVAAADRDLIDEAFARAAEAKREFARRPTHRRREALLRIAEAIRNREEELARWIVVESGKPITAARGEVDRAVSTFTIAAGECGQPDGETLPLDVSPATESYGGLWRRFPLGVASLITPFNFPLNLVAHKVAPAIAAGCPFVLKPAPRTPVSALLLGEMLAACDLPEGTWSILPCEDELAPRFTEDERIDVISFTGSAKIGWKIRANAGFKRVLLELGGNAACILDEDADLEDAVERLIAGAFGQAGQSCISVQRVYAHRSRYEDLLDRLRERVGKVPMGDPTEESTLVGPMISLRDAERVEAWVNEAVASGAEILVGGRREGRFYRPTVLTGAPEDARVVREEIFGPVMTVDPFDEFDDAVRRANDPRFGLQAGVFTNRFDRVLRAFEGIEVGGVVINDVPTARVDSMPYGGARESGLGREGLRYAIEEMCERRMLLWRRA